MRHHTHTVQLQLILYKAKTLLLTSTAVLLADPTVLTGVVVAGSWPAAALVHPKNSPAPWTGPLCHISCSDWLPVQLQALEAPDEIEWMPLDLRRRVSSEQSEEQSTVGTHHPTRLAQGGGGWMLLVQGQSHCGGVNLQQDAVPMAI